MTVDDENRKIGLNVSVPYKLIKIIDKRVKDLEKKNRSAYIYGLILKDLDERNNL